MPVNRAKPTRIADFIKIGLGGIVASLLILAPITRISQAAALPGANDRIGHTYPRTAIWQTYAAVEDWYARFDLAFTRMSNSSFIANVREMNPDILWLPTRDFNAAYQVIDDFPEEWYLRDSNGNRVDLYGSGIWYADLSDLGLRYTGSASGMPINDQRLIDWFPQYLAQLAEDAGADGIGTDGLYHRAHLQSRMWEDVDLDRNGVNDLVEHGKEWAIDHWTAGVDFLLRELRTRLDDKILVINTGSPDTPGIELANGYVAEHIGGVFSWQFSKNHHEQTVQNVRQPAIFLMQSNPVGGDPHLPDPSKNYYSFMRFGLARAMLLGEYFAFESRDSKEHYWNRYYDEFDLDIGYPTGEMVQLRSTGQNGMGVWVRFFDYGAVLVNISETDQHVTAQDLQALSGYEGPYWRFQGGQDPEVNNGKQFDNITLDGHTYQTGGLTPIIGDAIILVKSPTTTITDIIIDNVDFGTSPGTTTASLSSGFGQHGCNSGGPGGSDYYTLRCAWNPGSYAFASAPGASQETAVFRPTIGLAGQYEVFEWHPSLEDGSEATNVVHTIHHSKGSTTKIVNQSSNPGQWNSLGTYTFMEGTEGSVTISAEEANGTVAADAIKFVYRGNTTQTTFIDVPFTHWAHDYIETLYQAGYTAGCSSDPLMYCPDATMTRAESAVFVERGIHGADHLPAQPNTQIFDDVPLWEWFAKWATGLWDDGYTAGCGTDPLVYCPLQEHTRAEGSVFFLRMMHGADYVPPEPAGLFSDVPIDMWYADWAEAAYVAGLIRACETSPELKFCPYGPLDRAMAAYMMVQAKGLEIPSP